MLQNLICTVGTSLFGNLKGLEKRYMENPDRLTPAEKNLAETYRQKKWPETANALLKFDSSERICGAEINSIASMIKLEYVSEDCRLFFCHSQTEEGRAIGEILNTYYEKKGHVIETLEIAELQDENPQKFRIYGLRNLAKEICKILRTYSSSSCAINATGGYKAQIAIAVMLGQAIGIPVYYKHERFDEIIMFPPMPVSLDFEVWMKGSGILFNLEASDMLPKKEYKEEWDERYDSLVEYAEIDNEEWITLSATGQIFHDTFNERFKANQKHLLPGHAQKQHPPRLEDSGNMKKHPEILKFMKKVTDEVPQVIRCYTYYFNPDLSRKTHFRYGSKGIECIYSNGSYTVNFVVETTAEEPAQMNAMVACLNRQYV